MYCATGDKCSYNGVECVVKDASIDTEGMITITVDGKDEKVKMKDVKFSDSNDNDLERIKSYSHLDDMLTSGRKGSKHFSQTKADESAEEIKTFPGVHSHPNVDSDAIGGGKHEYTIKKEHTLENQQSHTHGEAKIKPGDKVEMKPSNRHPGDTHKEVTVNGKHAGHFSHDELTKHGYKVFSDTTDTTLERIKSYSNLDYMLTDKSN